MVAQTRLYTADEFLSLPDDGKIYELHNGVIIEVAGSKYVQTILAAWIVYLIIRFLEDNKIGGVVSGADGTYVLDRYNTRIPDVAYITEDTARRQKQGEYLKGAPDLAVEVISESNTATEMKQRVGAYLNAGTRLVWLVYPETRSIEIYQDDEDTLTLKVDDVLDSGDVLPGFRISVREIFARLDR